eukprot:Sspe_Gene.15694::Locus_5467_Transcript_1_1_Confidence_1.000_Length_1039::g.15694::m.15694
MKWPRLPAATAGKDPSWGTPRRPRRSAGLTECFKGQHRLWAVLGAFFAGVFICCVLVTMFVLRPSSRSTSRVARVHEVSAQPPPVRITPLPMPSLVEALRDTAASDQVVAKQKASDLARRVAELERAIQENFKKEHSSTPPPPPPPNTPTPTPTPTPSPSLPTSDSALSEGQTVVTVRDIKVGGAVIVQKGNPGTVKARVGGKWSIQFLGMFGATRPVVVLVDEQDVRRATWSGANWSNTGKDLPGRTARLGSSSPLSYRVVSGRVSSDGLRLRGSRKESVDTMNDIHAVKKKASGMD